MPDKKKKETHDLAQVKSGTLSQRMSTLSVGTLELALLKKYPASDAEEWDRTGLLVGDTTWPVQAVAIALDPSVEAIKRARDLGANVLVTHHPAFLSAPDSFSPQASVALSSGAGVWAAIEQKVALMNFHTSLDVSPDVARILPRMLHLQFKGILDPIDERKRKGYGQICVPSKNEATLSLAQLAARCTSVFGRQPRVWGDFDQKAERIVTCTGSCGDLSAKCLGAGIDVLICGEIRYHDALAASQAGLSIIDLGHDISELPLVAALVAAVEAAGVAKDMIKVIEQNSNWDLPETTRV